MAADAMAADAFPAALDPLAHRVWRWGRAGIALAFALAVAGSYALAAVIPAAVFAVPVVVVVVAAGALVVRRPGYGAATAIVLGLLLGGFANAVPAGKVIFGLYLGVYVAVWHLSRWANGDRFVVSFGDTGAALLISLGVVVGLGLGVLFRNSPSEMVSHFQAFVPILLYFPIKQACARVRFGPEIIAGALLTYSVGAAVENGIETKQVLNSATQLWQIIDVRTAFGEIALLAALVLTLALMTSAQSRRALVGYLALFGVFVIGMILTKSRGFWVSTVLSVVVLIIASDGTQRRRLIGVGLLGSVAVVTLSFIIASDYVVLIATGIVKRFTTLSTAATADVSLVNRFVENASVWSRIRENPILGHGWGVKYSYYSLISEGTRTWGFVHNAYLGIWLKLGLWGLCLVIWVWVSAIWIGLRSMRDRRLLPRHRALAGAAGAALVGIALAANTSNPFELADQTLILTTCWAIAHGTSQHARYTVSGTTGR